MVAWVWQRFYFPASSRIILLDHVVTALFSFQTLSNYNFPCQSNLVMWHCRWTLCAGQCFYISSMLSVIQLLSKTDEQMEGKDTVWQNNNLKKNPHFYHVCLQTCKVYKYKIHDKSASCCSKPILWFHTKKVDENIINIHKKHQNCPYNCTLFSQYFKDMII